VRTEAYVAGMTETLGQKGNIPIEKLLKQFVSAQDTANQSVEKDG